MEAHGVTDVLKVVGGGIRSLTDVLSRWQNSIPTVAVSGQMHYSTTAKKTYSIIPVLQGYAAFCKRN